MKLATPALPRRWRTSGRPKPPQAGPRHDSLSHQGPVVSQLLVTAAGPVERGMSVESSCCRFGKQPTTRPAIPPPPSLARLSGARSQRLLAYEARHHDTHPFVLRIRSGTRTPRRHGKAAVVLLCATVEVVTTHRRTQPSRRGITVPPPVGVAGKATQSPGRLIPGLSQARGRPPAIRARPRYESTAPPRSSTSFNLVAWPARRNLVGAGPLSLAG